MFFAKMVRNQEFTAAQSSGQSIWQFLLPTLFIVVLLGFFWISVFNPISSVMTAKYETIENTSLRNEGNALSVSSGGLWIRENIKIGHSILHSRNISETATYCHLSQSFYSMMKIISILE